MLLLYFLVLCQRFLQLLLTQGAKRWRDIVVETLAGLGRELLSGADQRIPLFFCESVLQVFAGYLIFDDSIEEAGIEIVASTNGTHGLHRCYWIFLVECILCKEVDSISTLSIDELLGIESYL